MNAISFPNIFTKLSTKVISDHDATLQNLKNLLLSEQGEFKGDPYYGVKLKRYLFEQNNAVLKDILIDEIYTQVALFMPQLKVERKNIDITQKDTTLYATIKATNMLDFTIDTYDIVLLTEGDSD